MHLNVAKREIGKLTAATAACHQGCVKTSDCNGRGELVSAAARDLDANLDFLQ